MIRTLLVLGCLVTFLLALVGMYWGWSGRARRQASIPALPEVPATFTGALAPALTGLYIGTTVATEWQNRIVVHSLGERADAVATCTAEGVLIDRQGSAPIFIPSDQLIDARLEAAVAGKVMGAGGLLVFRWQHGEHTLDTAMRADDKSLYPQWVNAIEGRALHG